MAQTSNSTQPASSLIYDLRSIVQHIELECLFPSVQPLEVELGSGDGSFLARYAGEHPEGNFIGVERLLGRLRKLDRKARRAGLTNVRGVQIESAYFLEYLLPRHSVTALHIYFPDPWPKRKHRGNRLVNERFPALAFRALASSGAVYFRTDDADYFHQMTALFSSDPAFRPFETPAHVASVVTDFQQDFEARGIRTLIAAYRAIGKTEGERHSDIDDGTPSITTGAGRTAAAFKSDLGVSHPG